MIEAIRVLDADIGRRQATRNVRDIVRPVIVPHACGVGRIAIVCGCRKKGRSGEVSKRSIGPKMQLSLQYVVFFERRGEGLTGPTAQNHNDVVVVAVCGWLTGRD